MPEKASMIIQKVIGTCLDEETIQLLEESCSFVTFPKDTVVLLQGDLSQNLYYIVSGLVRGYYIDEEGNDITKSFATENDFLSTKGLLTDNPSLFNVECLEDCYCIQIPYSVCNQIMEENKDVFRYFTNFVITAMENLEIRTRDLVMKNAEERYRIFLKQYPMLSKRINQKYIASYIGIRTGSLSRIRKKFR